MSEKLLIVEAARRVHATVIALSEADSGRFEASLAEVGTAMEELEAHLEGLATMLGPTQVMSPAGADTLAAIGDMDDALQAIVVCVALESGNIFRVNNDLDDPLTKTLGLVCAHMQWSQHLKVMKDPTLPWKEVTEILPGPWNQVVPRRLRLLGLVHNSIAEAGGKDSIETE